ncbi:mucin-associated surface protein (MASP), partial [Trypanosoma cruzi]
MMTMTGRVLLVCALCVLWCDAGGGGRAEPPSPDSSDTTPEMNLQKKEEVVGVTGQGDQSGKQEVPKAAAPTRSELQELPLSGSPAQPPGGGASVTPTTTTDSKDQNAEEGKKEEKKKEEEKQQEDAKDEDEDEHEEEEDEEEEEEEEEKEEKVNEEEDGGDGANEEGDTKEEVVTDAAEVTSAGGQEQPSLPSGAEGASNMTNPNSTQTTGDDDPTADGAGTRDEKQNENKDANPKETPVT